MANRKVTKVLIGIEDLLLGTGSVDQERYSGTKSITRIDANGLPYEGSTSLRTKIGKKVEVVDNIAALQLLDTDTLEEKYIFVLGYNTPGDGGVGLFYLDSTSTDTEDLSKVFNPDNLDNGRWIRMDLSKQISPDNGDVSITIEIGDHGIQLFETPLTVNRSVTLPVTGLYKGLTYTVVRLDTAAFTLDVGGIKTIPSQEAAAVTVTYNGTAWKVTDYSVITPAPIAGFVAILDAFPIGSIYMTTVAGNPAVNFGGTWVQTARGRCLVGEGTSDASYTAGASDGESTHTLTTDEMPAHTHTFVDISVIGPPSTYDTTSGSSSHQYINNQPTSSTGNDQPHNNMPPYLVVYIWTRTA